MGCCQFHRFERAELVLIPANTESMKVIEDEFDDISLNSHQDSQVFEPITEDKTQFHIRSISSVSTRSLGSSLYRNEFELAFLVSPSSIRASLNDSMFFNQMIEANKKSLQD
ncbi:unnamed protein product [Blepharisma stoltei]|uniref:Uncharacterized protein n=1 Tax=Blepharisma stoltei TaxID=1481888 RepID=A0AAU9JW39_9CILI|nr:unnamed protein product [Blepharisma stoltei]